MISNSAPFARASFAYVALALFLLFGATPVARAALHSADSTVSGQHVLDLTRQFLQAAPKRYANSPGHLAAEAFIKAHFTAEDKAGNFETDSFYASTPIGQVAMRNYIVKYPGKKDGILVLVSHYETNYPLKDIGFVGANDGATTSALLIALGEHFRAHPPQGYSVWLVFDDGEEAIHAWSASDSLYGTRHLAAKWAANGTLKQIKALMVVDMIGDKDLNIDFDDNSTPWLRDLLKTAAKDTGHSGSIYANRINGGVLDDHNPFGQRGVPVLDLIDIDYGPHNATLPDGYHHTQYDTLDKLSAHSLQISSDLILEMIHLIDQR